ncbi:MAG TPA: hypothetical protein VIG99_27120 [Myxococcaceae bacterium]|jgi:hypothetical protein
MSLKPSSWLFSLAVAAAILVSGRAHAQSCTTYVADKLNWVAQGGGYYLNVRGNSINSSAAGGYGLVSHVEGYLDQYTAAYTYYDYLHYQWVTVPAKVSSHANFQSFSDRFYVSGQPFSKNAKDQLGITLSGDGKITITLDSWGGGAITINAPTCANEVISGFSNDGTLWSFVLKKTWLG